MRLLLILLILGCNGSRFSGREFREFTLRADPYGVKIHILITKDLLVARDYMRENVDPTAEIDQFKGADAETWTSQESDPVIWFQKEPDSETLAHEMFHATWDILNNAGIQLNNETDEVYAYLLGDLIRQYEGVKK